jgi:hypothetical protein
LLLDRWPGACLCINEYGKTPYDLTASTSSSGVDVAPRPVVDFMENATADILCVVLECILDTKSAAPPAVIQHVRDTIRAALPALSDDLISVSPVFLMQSVRPHVDQQLLHTLCRNNELQELLKEDEHFHELLCGIRNMNKTERTYFRQDPFDKFAGMSVLDHVSDTVDCLFVHLRENPFLCDRSARSSRKRKAPT